MKKYLLAILFLLATTYASAQQTAAWGDQGNGTYVNPILNADYSDPDVIRMGEKYYMVCSDFHYIGMPVLESTDMVNWTIISQVYNRFDYPKWDTNERFAVEEYLRANCEYPGKWHGKIEKMLDTAEGSVTVTRVWSEEFSVRAISFFRWQGEKILRLEEYWSDDGAPPEWRRKMQIGQKITED